MNIVKELKTLLVKPLAAGALALAVAGGAGAPASAQWDETYFPNVELVTQDGETVRLWDDLLDDKIVVVSFIYTECPDICGLATARLAQISDWLGDRLGRDIFFYSISLDPATDTPDKLKAFGEAFDAPPGWVFLTGDPADVDVVRYKFGERSETLRQHRSDMVIGNAATGEWRRASLMGSLVVATEEILSLDPDWIPASASPTVNAGDHAGHGTHAEHGAAQQALVVENNPGEGLFISACAACHSIGDGVRVGPDLAGVTLRRDREWLERYIQAPQRMIAQGDPVAVALDAQFPVVRMPNLGLGSTDVADLLVYLHTQTELMDKVAMAETQPEHDHSEHDHGADHSHEHSHGQEEETGKEHVH
jgi:protein SCO1